MENEKVAVIIEDYEDKKASNGRRYTRFKTSDGWMSCFEKDVIDNLKEKEGEQVTVSIAIDPEKGFKNIRSIVKADVEVVDSKGEPVVKPKNIVVKNTTTMYVSYAKDIFCELYTPEVEPAKIMELAISMVLQAKKVFE